MDTKKRDDQARVFMRRDVKAGHARTHRRVGAKFIYLISLSSVPFSQRLMTSGSGLDAEEGENSSSSAKQVDDEDFHMATRASVMQAPAAALRKSTPQVRFAVQGLGS